MSPSRDPVVVATFGHRHEAEMALGLLEDAGIRGFVQADDAVMEYPPSSIRGARLLVAPENASAAREVLEGEGEIPPRGEMVPAIEELDEEGGRRFAYGLAAVAVGAIAVFVDRAESPLRGAPGEVGVLGWIGIGIAALGIVAIVRSTFE